MQTTSQAVEPVRIGALAEQTGCSVPTIRYYEEIGLIPPARRRSSGHRVYDASAVQTLGFVRRCRDFGFTLEQIRLLASLSRDPRRDCDEARDLAQEHLKGVRAKMLESDGSRKDARPVHRRLRPDLRRRMRAGLQPLQGPRAAGDRRAEAVRLLRIVAGRRPT